MILDAGLHSVGQTVAVDVEKHHEPAGLDDREQGVERRPAPVLRAGERAVGRELDHLRAVDRQRVANQEVDLAVGVDVNRVEIRVAGEPVEVLDRASR